MSRLDVQDKYSNGVKDVFGFTKSVSKDNSNAILQLKSADEQKQHEQSSAFSKIQAEEQEISHRDAMAVMTSTILKKKRASEQAITPEESIYESTVKAVLANLRSELSGLTSLRKTRNSDLAGELLEILAK